MLAKLFKERFGLPVMAEAVHQSKRCDQRKALLNALVIPSTPLELFFRIRPLCPKVQLRDLWRSLRKLQERELVRCLTPKAKTCKIYFFTRMGCEFMRERYGIVVSDRLRRISWRKYSEVIKGKARKAALMAMDERWKSPARTVADIRRFTRNNHALCMSAAIRAVADLEHLGLIERVEVKAKGQRPMFVLTPSGKRIVNYIKDANRGLPNGSASSSIKGKSFSSTWQKQLNRKP